MFSTSLQCVADVSILPQKLSQFLTCMLYLYCGYNASFFYPPTPSKCGVLSWSIILPVTCLTATWCAGRWSRAPLSCRPPPSCWRRCRRTGRCPRRPGCAAGHTDIKPGGRLTQTRLEHSPGSHEQTASNTRCLQDPGRHPRLDKLPTGLF